GQRQYDRASSPGSSLAGLHGPAGVLLHSPGGIHLLTLNRYLRFESGLAPALREIAILTTVREMQSPFQWAAHEPEARKLGVLAETIDVIKHDRSTQGLAAEEAAIIDLGREIWRDHKVASATFAKASDLFGVRMLVDLVILMGAY